MSLNENECLIFPVQRIISTSIAAMSTALFMTPFDVVRIRLQSQNHQFVKGDCFVFRNGLGDYICTCFNGHEPVPWYNRSIPGRYNGTIDALLKITRNEGIRSLWSGLPPTLVMSLPNTIIYFTTYEQLKCFMGYERNNLNLIIPGISGGLARILAVVATSPIELIRTKKMSAKLSYTDLHNILRESIQSNGLRTLWRGLIPTLWRDLPFSIFYWSVYERLKLFIMKQFSTAPTLAAFYSGATAGALATIFTHPFDTIKSIRQVQLGSNQVQSTERTLHLLYYMFKEQGIHSLYKGLVPRLIKVSPACAIMISTIEFFRQNVFKQTN
ncbi:unnamed protein product [Rotaria sordida]|uniref:Mitochondrial carrier protein n=1 Tax=Rotaria sordida TaxID=392033 RepID=A0A815DBI7_9BILA|nr:unnamed protein product [Rotaria sordida]CAF1270160.1 unnamed protein product [Rotaria sordida]CAF1294800.1 unnamed protein product [Rotaria sordida]CAF1308379.1 unnamed protein product [Rotaria sordida]CAF1441823.1 unnamed protein product [Rotaria sordida]